MADLFIPPHFGFETTSVSNKKRVFTHQSGRTVELHLDNGDPEWHFFDIGKRLVLSYPGQLTKEHVNTLFYKWGWLKEPPKRKRFEFDSEAE